MCSLSMNSCAKAFWQFSRGKNFRLKNRGVQRAPPPASLRVNVSHIHFYIYFILSIILFIINFDSGVFFMSRGGVVWVGLVSVGVSPSSNFPLNVLL